MAETVNEGREGGARAYARRAAAPAFAFAMFSGAALLFVLQPLFARLATPLLGGSPSVWNVSMAFFQAALLLGYLYAHWLARLKDLRLQALIHAVVLLAAWFALPVRVNFTFGPPSSEHPALWLVGTLALSVGAPFAAISATAPLLQSWYAQSGRADAHDPYYLYAASNAGSFIGLLAYPALIEPLFGARAQSVGWSAGYVLTAALILVSAAIVLTAQDATSAKPEAAPISATPSSRQRLLWIAAAAVPSALILGVTLHITTDIASLPLLWVAPLALYLVTLVIAFTRGSERLLPVVQILFPFALFAMIATYFLRNDLRVGDSDVLIPAWTIVLAANLIGFFLSALLCHLVLVRQRPSADRLTEFYFFVSLGGVLGGAFVAFVAPLIFNDVYEYPLALAAAALFLPRGQAWMPRLTDCTAAAAAFMAFLVLVTLRLETRDAIVAAGAVGAAAAVIAAGWDGEERIPPFRYGFLIAAALMALVVVWIAFNLDTIVTLRTINGTRRLFFVSSWAWALGIVSFLVLLFATHATLQPRKNGTSPGDIGLGASIPAASILLVLPLMRERLDNEVIETLALAFALIALFFNRMRPAIVGLLVLAAFATIFVDEIRGRQTVAQVRTFFGVLRVLQERFPTTPPADLRILLHGTTLHGAQWHSRGLTQLPLTYYNPNTALGEAILAGLNTGDRSNIALIGLGAGTTACLTRRTDSLTVYEIDPTIVRFSTTPNGYFTYVPECQPHAQVRLGDARLQIQSAPDGAYDVIVVDAFSSDAIPAHLLTREAIALYLRKTSDRGIVVLHLSNRNLALVTEAARVAQDLHAPALYRMSEDVRDPHQPFYSAIAASVMIVAKTPEALAQLPLLSRGWRVLAPPPGRAWSDDYINLPRALWENLDGTERCLVYPPGAPPPDAQPDVAQRTLEQAQHCRERLGG